MNQLWNILSLLHEWANILLGTQVLIVGAEKYK